MNGTRRELRRWREAVQSGDARRAHHFLNKRQLLFRFLHYFVHISKEISQRVLHIKTNTFFFKNN
jgi:hypothetical protein